MNVRIEHRPGDRTVGVALLLPVGSYAEPPGMDGVAHLIEHLLFKRTGTKPPSVLRRLENDAGFVDAYTDRDHTGFLCRTLPADVGKTADYLLDVVFGSTFTPGDFAAEREVVLQEICEDADDPWAAAYDAYARRAFGRYGRLVGGCPATVRRLSFADVRGFVRRNYRAADAWLAVSGPVPSVRAVERVVARYDRKPRAGAPPGGGTGFPDFSPLARYWSPRRDYRMGYLVYGFPFRTLPLRDLLALRVFAATTGEGPSSILWRELREKRSLVYDISTSVDRYQHAVTCHFALSARAGRLTACRDVLERAILAWRRGRVDPEDVRIGLKVVQRAELSRREDPLDWAAWLAYSGMAGIPPHEPLRVLEDISAAEVIARVKEGLLPEPVVGRA